MPKRKAKRLHLGDADPPSKKNGSGSGPTVSSPAPGGEATTVAADPTDWVNKLSLEVLCHIMDYLYLRNIMALESLSRKLKEAVTMNLRVRTSIDFTEGKWYGWMPNGFTDEGFKRLVQRCPELVSVYGLHPQFVVKRRRRGIDYFSVPGIIEALQSCPNLFGVETSNLDILEAIVTYLPHVYLLGQFKNRNGYFPICVENRVNLPASCRVTSLYLTGVVTPDLPAIDLLRHLYLKWVKFTSANPFRDFQCPNLRTFVMRSCAGPSNALKYVPLMTGLSGSRYLERIELVRVPFLGGLIQHVVEDSWRTRGYRNLTKIAFGACKNALEVDLGFLVITAANHLQELDIQPSLTKDSVFAALKMADVDFPQFDTLNLGFIDEFPEAGKWTNAQLVQHGLADVTENPSNITDNGMRSVGQVFPGVKYLSMYNAPHLHNPHTWHVPALVTWSRLKDLTIRRCHAVKLDSFCQLITLLPAIEYIHLEEMFREPPKGCLRVGLSAGTGIGVSSALVSNTGTAGGGSNSTQGATVGHNSHDDDSSDSDSDMEVNQGETASDQPSTSSGDSRKGGKSHGHSVGPKGKGFAKKAPKEEAEDIVRPGMTSQSCQATSDEIKEDVKVATEAEKAQEAEKKLAEQGSTQAPAADPPASEDGGDSSSSSDEEDEQDQGANRQVQSDTQQPTASQDNSSQSQGETSVQSEPQQEPSNQSGEGSSQQTDQPNVVAQNGLDQSEDRLPQQASCSSSTPNEDQESRNQEVTIQQNGAASTNGQINGESGEESDIQQNVNSDPVAGPSSCDANSNEGRESPRCVCGRSLNRRPLQDGAGPSNSTEVNTAGPSTSQQNGESTNSRTSTCGNTNTEPRGSVTCNGNVANGDVEAPRTSNGNVGENEARTPDDNRNVAQSSDVADTPSGSNSTQEPSDTSQEDTTGDKPTDSTTAQPPAEKSPAPAAKPAEKVITGRTKKELDELRGADPRYHRPVTRSQNTPGSSGSTAHHQKTTVLRRVGTRDVATSTSDPVIEDDYPQVLTVQSSTLVSLSLHMVGVTNIVVKDCPKLTFISGTACRVLKKIQLDKSPRLNRVSFQQCRKVDVKNVVQQVCSLPAERNRMVTLRPMHKVDPSVLEQKLFSGCHDYHLCLLWDHSNPPSIVNKTRAHTWMDLVSNINQELLKNEDFKEAEPPQSGQYHCYPWGRDIYKVDGPLHSGRFEITSDFPWLKALMEAEPNKWAKPPPDNVDTKEGIYYPRDKGHLSTDLCLESLQDTISACKQKGLRLFRNVVLMYIQTCDVEGQVVDDRYV
ncbi:F-box only protein 38-like isoform X1 [Branchiostoma floridae]|uniref:F-box only protein 38-like isoform X1 n=1 Tax=Branchiostoma floridae TaxID=7739 RepID=A0A9J7LLK1_BRAFL|nr:F-box only protein 38-like isoform X1 [Branchiostoma floridae]XP_035684394.1 F-box only protein 38-like isoform X1 [Branchiostoma floridae]